MIRFNCALCSRIKDNKIKEKINSLKENKRGL